MKNAKGKEKEIRLRVCMELVDAIFGGEDLFEFEKDNGDRYKVFRMKKVEIVDKVKRFIETSLRVDGADVNTRAAFARTWKMLRKS